MKLLHSRAFSNHSTRVRHLEVLGLPENASVNEIKAAYIKLCKEFHPDVNQSPVATEQFQKIKLAFDQLQGEKLGNVAAASTSSTERDDTSSQEKHSPEFQAWKAKQRRTRDFDDWLRKVQYQGRNQRFKKSSSTDEEFSSHGSKTNFSRYDSDRNFREKFYNFKFEEKSPEPDKSYQTEAYLQYEKNFIARLDFLLGLQKKMNPEFSINDHQRKIDNRHYLAPYIFRVVMRTVVCVSLVVVVTSSVLGWSIILKSRSFISTIILAGYEIYNCRLGLPSQPQEVREEYQESFNKKSGTLDDI